MALPDTSTRDRMQSFHADVVDMLRAIDGGRPVPEHVQRNAHHRAVARLRADIRHHMTHPADTE